MVGLRAFAENLTKTLASFFREIFSSLLQSHPHMPKPIFISHAEVDKEFVDHFLDTLLMRGLNLSTNDIFCTSLPGAGIKTGRNFFEYIKEEVKGCKVIILVLTPQYMESPFCLAEAGASWVLEDSESCHVIPVVVPPLKFSELKATLAVTQGENIESEEDLDDIRDSLEEAGVLVNDPKTAAWTVAKKKFQNGLTEALDSMSPPKKIPLEKVVELEDSNAEFLKQSEQDGQTIKTLRSQIAELEKCKDKSEVLAIKAKHTGTLEQFQKLREGLRNTLASEGQFVLNLLYYGFNNLPLRIPPAGSSDHDEFWDDFYAAKEKSLVFEEPSDGVSMEHPRLKAPSKALHQISDFLEEYDSEISDWVEENWECTVAMDDKEFWDRLTKGNSMLPRRR